MERRDQLQQLHLALEDAVDRLTSAHRVASTGEPVADVNARLEAVFQEIVELRNLVREALMKEMAKPPPPLIRTKK